MSGLADVTNYDLVEDGLAGEDGLAEEDGLLERTVWTCQ